MTVQKIYFDGQIIDKDDEINARQGQLIIDGALCNDSVQKEGQEIGDPTEIALVNFSEKHDLPVEKCVKNISVWVKFLLIQTEN